MKVVYILPLYTRAGAEVLFLNNLKVDVNKGNDFGVIALGLSPYFKEELESLNVKYIDIGRDKKKYIAKIRSVKQFIKNNNYQIIYGQNMSGNLLASIIGKVAFNKKFVISHERGGGWLIKSNLGKKMVKFWINNSDLIFCNSHAAKRVLELKYNAKSDKIRVIHNGVRELNESSVENKGRIIFIGRLEEIKSPQTVLEVSKILKEKYNLEFETVFLGDGPLLSDLEAQVVENNLKNVSFKGNVKNVYEYLSNSKYLVLPSIREPFGNVLIEAAYAKTLAIATKIDGIPEVIIDGKSGILIPATINPEKRKLLPEFVYDSENDKLIIPKKINPMDIAKKIFELENNSIEYNKLTSFAYSRAKKQFSVQAYNERITNEFDKIRIK